jgi:dTDP-4-amino-4,6-dideoxygalactose transaminase
MTKHKTPDEIPMAKPFVPPVGDLLPYLGRIWESRVLTNGGTVHAEFEQALCEYLGVKHICLFANGTLALMTALRALQLRGEVITTPFTSPATVQAIYWNGLKPVFADIDETDLNIDPRAIEAAITPETCAILPVHLFGTPCDVARINQLAQRHNLKVLYDAAHCFGVELYGNPLCNFGDLSAMSFHATKVFNTLEGGAIVCHDEGMKNQIDALKNTGLGPDHQLKGYGLNAKMNELQAAFGLCQLPYVEDVIALRKAATLKYRELLEDLPGVRMQKESEDVRQNYSYFPVLINPEEFGADRDELYDHLKVNNIVTRKYFYPLVSDFPEFEMYKTVDLPVARKVSGNILCLPLFHDIAEEQITRVVHSIRQWRGDPDRVGGP